VRDVSPVAAGPGLITRGDANKAVTITGIVPDRYVAVTRFNEKIVAGELRLNPGEVVIGTDLAKDLGAGLGDKVRLSTPTSPGDAYQVRGIYDLGQRTLNRAYAYVNLATAQALLDLPGGVSSLDLSVDDMFGAENLAQRLQRGFPHEVESWRRANPQLSTALNNQTVMTLLVRFFLALVVAIGVASVLIVSVVQKTKEIGILRAMGAGRGRILRVFLLQGAMIGAGGGILGSACGYLLTMIMSNVLRADDGSPLFQPQFNPQLYLYTLLGAGVLGLLAAVMPARRAARLDPAQAIRI
jgi:lipoprotein-releasing system permease protein